MQVLNWFSPNWPKFTKFGKISKTRKMKDWKVSRKNIKKLRRSPSQLPYWLFVLGIHENSSKNVSAPETNGITKYRPLRRFFIVIFYKFRKAWRTWKTWKKNYPVIFDFHYQIWKYKTLKELSKTILENLCS